MVKFQRVSNEEFTKASGIFSGLDYVIKWPQRATSESAGYDIYSPFDLTIQPGDVVTIPTGFKIELPPRTFLMIVPRSGLGFKYQISLSNTVGIIDADYFNNPDNEGHIFVKLVNRGNEVCHIKKGQAICQGIVMLYMTTIDDKPMQEERNGGLGSTDGK